MWFGDLPVDRAEGAVLAHSVQAGERRLRKGLVLEPAHLDTLRAAGVSVVRVARLGAGDVSEDVAAARLADALCGPGLRASRAATGRVNLHATARGVVRIDVEAVTRVNTVDPAITLATLHPFHHVQDGAMVATIKIIPYGVAGRHLDLAAGHGAGALSLSPTVLRRAALIETVIPEATAGKGATVTAQRLAALGVELVETIDLPHAEPPLAQALGDLVARGGCDLILILTGSATSDIHDVAPAALRAAGGRVAHYGMPVDPGNLLFLGSLSGLPVIGLPGCARSLARNGADWVLERVVCGVPVGGADIMAMGVGGLLKESPVRPRPRAARDHG